MVEKQWCQPQDAGFLQLALHKYGTSHILLEFTARLTGCSLHLRVIEMRGLYSRMVAEQELLRAFSSLRFKVKKSQMPDCP